jgi:hypothetical protein
MREKRPRRDAGTAFDFFDESDIVSNATDILK